MWSMPKPATFNSGAHPLRRIRGWKSLCQSSASPFGAEMKTCGPRWSAQPWEHRPSAQPPLSSDGRLQPGARIDGARSETLAVSTQNAVTDGRSSACGSKVRKGLRCVEDHRVAKPLGTATSPASCASSSGGRNPNLPSRSVKFVSSGRTASSTKAASTDVGAGGGSERTTWGRGPQGGRRGSTASKLLLEIEQRAHGIRDGLRRTPAPHTRH